MKLKSLLLFFWVCLIALLIPSCVQAATGVDTYGNEYEILDDSTVKLTYVKPKQHTNDIDDTKYSEIVLGPLIGEKNYTVVSISADALDGITEAQDLYVSLGEECKNINMETTDMQEFLKNINNVYVRTDEVDYYIEAGWPEEKLECYKIKEQPQDKVVTAGNIAGTDTLKISAISVLGVGQTYSWYYCDKDGKITNKYILGSYATLPIPTDLAYDHANNKAKDYYFICVLGDNTPAAIRSDVVKVTVNPGDYKVAFHFNTDDDVNPVVLTVNDDRKIESSDLSKIPTLDKLNQYKEGTTFLGWTTYDDTSKIISTDEFNTMVFDKSMDFYPVWEQGKIIIDANGGKFEDGSTRFEGIVTNFGTIGEEMTEPTRDGYKLVDFTDEKDGGDSIMDYDDEGRDYFGIIFYAQWEPTSGSSEGGVGTGTGTGSETENENENKNESGKGDKDETPGTGENIMPYEVIFAISSVGLATMFVTSKKKIRKH